VDVGKVAFIMNNFAEEYKSATEVFLNLISTLNESDLDKSDKEGWTPRQVIHHMADSESQSYARLRRLIAEPGTTIQGYDEGKWAESESLGYRILPVEDSVAIIKAVRKASYELLTRISEAQLENSGVHTETGNYTVRNWLASYVKHPIDHANQIKGQLN
jgi:hypothetical protein